MPSPEGNRTTACACPLRSVLDDAETIPAPGDAENWTCAPATGLPWSSCSAIFKGCGNSAPGNPFWPSPEIFVSWKRTSVAARTVYEPSADDPVVSTAWTETTPEFALAGSVVSQLYAPLAVLTRK